ncbi:MAG: hypothetical protein JXA21_20630 [Anaerolineae bacterium]|nr:hypothetical protein [Anaerolineae bacterium]
MNTTLPQTLWQQTLKELELQMTRGTFDTWLRGSECSAYDEDSHVITVAVKNHYAIEWLENRLYSMIERTLHRITGNGVSARFIVTEEPPQQSIDSQSESIDSDWQAPDFDPANTRKVTGWFPVPEYACKFWAPLLGRTAWRVWEVIRQSDIRTDKSDWTPARRWSVPELARQVPCGSQALTGRNRVAPPHTSGATLELLHPIGEPEREEWTLHQPGAFDTLQAEGVAEISAAGDRRHRVYTISVRTSLPLLHPTQVADLRAELQTAHESWIVAHGLDPALW